jgi:hypothetical protein
VARFALDALGWIKLTAEHPGFNRAALVVAVLISLSFGWLVAGPLRPRSRLSAFGFAAACGLIASVVSFLFVGPFEAIRPRRDLLHPVGVSGDPPVYIISDPLLRRGPELANPDVAYLSRFLPAEFRDRSKEERDHELIGIKIKARHANLLQNIFTASWTTMLTVLVFYMALSFTSTAAATDPLASGRHLVARLGRYLEFCVPASLMVFCAVALFFLEVNRHVIQSKALSDWVSDWSLQIIPLIVWLGIDVVFVRMGQSRGWSAGARVVVELAWIGAGAIAAPWIFGTSLSKLLDVGTYPLYP